MRVMHEEAIATFVTYGPVRAALRRDAVLGLNDEIGVD